MKTLFGVVIFFLIASLDIPMAIADESYVSGLLGMIPKSTAAEALAALDSYKIQVETCLSEHPSEAYTSCAGLSPFTRTSNFTYAFAADSLFADNATYATDNYTIIATPTEGSIAQKGSVIKYIRNNAQFTCQGTGTFAQSC
jgi:hypothetical protein